MSGKKHYAKTALFFTAMFWGSTFAIGKIATEAFSPAFIIALRFTVASVVLILVSLPLMKLVNKEYIRDGFWMGVTLFASYMLQVAGLALDTSPGKSAFLCTTYSVLVPFLYWGITKKRPKLLHIFCVFICMIGIGILSLQGDMSMTAGDILTLLSGVPCAVNLVISAIVTQDKDPLLLTMIELAFTAVFAWVAVGVTNTFPAEFPMNTVGGIVYLGVIATALCLYLQSYGMKYADASIGGMLLSLESVFGVIFSIVLYKEHVTLRMLVGFIVIFTAIILSQWEGKKKEA